MKYFYMVFVSFFFLSVLTYSAYGQETRTLDGVQYMVIDPVTYAFNADSGRLQSRQKYVIDGKVLTVSGTTLSIQDIGLIHTFTLSSPITANTGANVTVYVEIDNVSSFQVKARVIKIEGNGISQVQSSSGNRSLDGVQYKIITPLEYSFNADSGNLIIGQKYVIDGKVLTVSGATLSIQDIGLIHTFSLNAPLRANTGLNVTVYVEIESVSSFQVMARVVKVETR
jgi:hypothetical protein